MFFCVVFETKPKITAYVLDLSFLGEIAAFDNCTISLLDLLATKQYRLRYSNLIKD